jgi:hypothetical protein
MICRSAEHRSARDIDPFFAGVLSLNEELQQPQYEHDCRAEKQEPPVLEKCDPSIVFALSVHAFYI